MPDKRFHHRRLAVALALGAPLLSPLAARAQTDKPRRIGVLYPLPRGGPNNMAVFFEALKELGYVEGRNLVVERRYSDGNDDRLATLAADLAQLEVEVLVAPGPAATRAARAATTTVPIVMGTNDPVEQGLIASLAQPGGNITGWCVLSTESAEKQLAILKEAMPRVRRAAVLVSPGMAGHSTRTGHLRNSARSMGVAVATYEITGPEALAGVFEAMRKDRFDEAFLVVPDPRVDNMRQRLASLAAEHRIPGVYTWRHYVDAGGLMSYGPSLPAMIQLWAAYVDKILKGARPGELPVQTPTKYELVLNQRAARELGFNFPAALMLAADAVVN